MVLASQAALEVMWASQCTAVSQWVSEWWLADFIDVTLVSEDTNGEDEKDEADEEDKDEDEDDLVMKVI